MEKEKKKAMLDKLKLVIRSRNKARKLEPLPLELNDEELDFIYNSPLLNSNFRHTFSISKSEKGRPALKITDNYLPLSKTKYGVLNFEYLFVGDGHKDADGYNMEQIIMVVKMLNDYQDLLSMVKHRF